MNDISIIIVNYNVKEYIIPCIQSIYKNLNNHLSFEIIVVDNNSKDESLKEIKSKFGQVKIIQNKINLGFSKGVNKGFKESNSNSILVLNPDTLLIDSSIKKIFSKIKRDSSIGIISPALYGGNYKIQQSAWKTPSLLNTALSVIHLDKLNFSKNYIFKKNKYPLTVDSVSGAAFITRASIFKKLNGFNSDLFWMEDIDYCKRVSMEGYKIIYDPEAKIIHLGGKSAEKNYKAAISNQLLSKIKYFNIYKKASSGMLLRFLILWVSLFKFLVFLSLSFFSKKYSEKSKGYYLVLRSIVLRLV